MLKPLWMHLDGIASRLRAVDEVCVGCDFDGTLTDIVSHPGVAVLSRRARTALERVSSTPRLELGVFSGRKLDDLRAMVWFPGTFLLGTAGFETLDAYGALSDGARTRVDAALAGTGCEDLLAYRPHHRLGKRRFKLCFEP